MRKVDLLIIYELKNRELENSALLAAEMERRGYSTLVLYNYSKPIRMNIEAKVIITPHLYEDQQLEFYINNKKQSNRNAISMQYEHITSEDDEDGINNPKGQAKRAQHIAWGEDQVRKYLNHGIEPSHIHKTGCVSMDFFRKEFRSYFLTKSQIAEKLNIDENKEWVLFVSSFAFSSMEKEEVLKNFIRSFGDDANTREKVRFTLDSYSQILIWLKAAAERYPNKLFIYRKHPQEKLSDVVKELEDSLPNFKCISDYSMRQWAVVSDKLYNWISTSQADIYFARKSSYILRPISIPHEMDISLFTEGEHITTEEDFIKSIDCDEYHSPISAEKLQYYYCNMPEGKMAFENIADLCEEMIKNSELGSDYHFEMNKDFHYYIKNFYDLALYYYGKNIRTPEWIINGLNKIPFMRTRTAGKLKILNDDLYKADEQYSVYFNKFRDLLGSIHSNA